ncbi:hypothetical protein [Streptomyces minutiscleroticus]|uniref:hypothetical protein n=1 Tax=Streptomyces minutiscleroticus TaxID=68238 RepID=UPI00167D6BCA|nr:hypothetical protein [Streptomyces minutiscleroticus]
MPGRTGQRAEGAGPVWSGGSGEHGIDNRRGRTAQDAGRASYSGGRPLIHPGGAMSGAALAILAAAALGTYGCLRAPLRPRSEAAGTAVADAPKELVP